MIIDNYKYKTSTEMYNLIRRDFRIGFNTNFLLKGDFSFSLQVSRGILSKKFNNIQNHIKNLGGMHGLLIGNRIGSNMILIAEGYLKCFESKPILERIEKLRLNSENSNVLLSEIIRILANSAEIEDRSILIFWMKLINEEMKITIHENEYLSEIDEFFLKGVFYENR